ncbi:MAG: hypothetical protein WCJ09_29210 [Planctomycetota bacterium]
MASRGQACLDITEPISVVLGLGCEIKLTEVMRTYCKGPITTGEVSAFADIG